jgi:hypothetical protein
MKTSIFNSVRLSTNVSRCLCFAALVFIAVASFAQTLERQRPPLSVHDALSRAEKYVTDKNIDVSKHFVSSVCYMKSGSWTNSSIGKGPYWQVTYELVQLVDGGEHFILIYMDGKIGDIGGL